MFTARQHTEEHQLNSPMQAADTIRILIVDDEETYLELLARGVSSFGYSVQIAVDGLQAIGMLKKNEFSIVITDMIMPRTDGMALIKYTKKHHPQTDIIGVTGFSKDYSFSDVISAGAADFLEKPFEMDVLRAKLQRVVRERKLINDLQTEIRSHDKAKQQLESTNRELKIEAEERKKTEKALRKAKEEAEKANKAKSSFLNTMSHELKTPMNGIIGLTSILFSTELTDQQRQYLEGVIESSDRLMKLINQILEYSEMDLHNDNGQALHPNHFRLPKLFDDLLSLHKPKAKAKELILSFITDESLSHDVIFGDSDLLSKVFNHLIDNAIKFSDSGKVTICGRIKEQVNSQKHLLHFYVQDQGCGIPQEQQEMIFNPFTQSEYYMTRQHGGSGIGLAICSSIIRLMEGEIWVESAKDKGATFNFMVPMELS